MVILYLTEIPLDDDSSYLYTHQVLINVMLDITSRPVECHLKLAAERELSSILSRFLTYLR